LYEDLIIIITAILIHYGLEYGKAKGDYSCPPYCEVKHKHIISKEKLDDWFNGNINVEREEGKYLY